MANEDEQITVKIGVFSGRENPDFPLDAAAQDEFANRMRSTIGTKPANPPAPPRLGQFYGFLVMVPAASARELDLPEAIEIRSGVVSPASPRTDNAHWQDAAGLEQFLIEQAVAAGHGEILQEYGIEAPKAE